MRQGTPGFNGKRLKQARDIYGLTITSLADMVGVSKQAISQFEKGDHDTNTPVTPRPEILEKMSQTLNFPKEFFLQESYISNNTPIHYRSLSAATKTARAKAESKFIWLQEIVSFIRAYVELPKLSIPNFTIDHTKLSYSEIEELATAARRHWGLGDGPIQNVLGLVENNGIVTSRIDLEAETLDALSQWSDYDGTPYICLSSSKNSAARSRFDLSHELAHLMFHKHLNNNVCYNPVVHSVLEKQAHRFASAFLMPAETFMNDLVSPSLDCFWALKEKWQTSIAAMIMRCQHLDVIDEEYARKLWINYSRRGWSKREPLDDKLPIEQPKLLRRSFELLLSAGIIMHEDIVHHLPYPVLHLEEILNLPKETLTAQGNIEYLPSLRVGRNTSDGQYKTVDSKIVHFPKRDS